MIVLGPCLRDSNSLASWRTYHAWRTTREFAPGSLHSNPNSDLSVIITQPLTWEMREKEAVSVTDPNPRDLLQATSTKQKTWHTKMCNQHGLG